MHQAAKELKDIKEQYVFSDEDGVWSFWDENNRPIGIKYKTIEEAINALYKYLELIND
jgi:hypothetical protein